MIRILREKPMSKPQYQRAKLHQTIYLERETVHSEHF